MTADGRLSRLEIAPHRDTQGYRPRSGGVTGDRTANDGVRAGLFSSAALHYRPEDVYRRWGLAVGFSGCDPSWPAFSQG